MMKNVIFLFVDSHQCGVVEDGEQVRLDRVRVGRLAKDLQEGWVGHEEEPDGQDEETWRQHLWEPTLGT